MKLNCVAATSLCDQSRRTHPLYFKVANPGFRKLAGISAKSRAEMAPKNRVLKILER